METVFDFFLRFKKSLRYRDFIIDLFTECETEKIDNNPEIINMEKMLLNNKDIRKYLYPGKIFEADGTVFNIEGVLPSTNDTIWSFKKLPFLTKNKPLLKFSDIIANIDGSIIENYKEKTPMTTSVGNIFVNQLALIEPFGDKIPFVNQKWKTRAVEASIVTYLLEADPNDHEEKAKRIAAYKTYINNMTYIGSFTEFAVPSLSKKSLMTSDKVAKKRAELLEKYKDQLDDPLIMIHIENELKILDKEHLKGDTSMGFFGNSSKVFDVQRKKMFLVGGMYETFGDDTKQFNFAAGTLDEGWKQEELHILFNDITKGSASRAIETAKGGAETKFFGRQFQESKIVEDDCGTTRGILITLSEYNYKSFINRHIVVKGEKVLLTEKNIKSFIGKEVILRSPKFCRSRTGYCYSCMDYSFKKLDLTKLNILPIQITSSFLLQSMKSMHGKSVSSFEITNLSQFTIGGT